MNICDNMLHNHKHLNYVSQVNIVPFQYENILPVKELALQR